MYIKAYGITHHPYIPQSNPDGVWTLCQLYVEIAFPVIRDTRGPVTCFWCCTPQPWRRV